MHRPNLEHEIILDLYKYEFDLPKEVIVEILSLPKITLIKDLESIIEDAITNYTLYKTENQQKEKGVGEPLAPVHAIFLLGELNAIEVLPLVDKFLMQSEEKLEFWLGDLITEDLWEPIYKLAKSDITQLFSLIKTPDIYVFAKSSHKTALMQYLCLHPDDANDLIPEYKELLNFLISRGKESNPIENWGDAAEDVSLFALDIIGNRLTIFESELEEMVKSNLFESYYPEEWEKVKSRLNSPREYETKVLSIVERYQDIHETWVGYNDILNEAIDTNFWGNIGKESSNKDIRLQPQTFHNSDMPYIKEIPKVGRNETCPCGSGKKYKKCCLKK